MLYMVTYKPGIHIAYIEADGVWFLMVYTSQNHVIYRIYTRINCVSSWLSTRFHTLMPLTESLLHFSTIINIPASKCIFLNHGVCTFFISPFIKYASYAPCIGPSNVFLKLSDLWVSLRQFFSSFTSLIYFGNHLFVFIHSTKIQSMNSMPDTGEAQSQVAHSLVGTQKSK